MFIIRSKKMKYFLFLKKGVFDYSKLNYVPTDSHDILFNMAFLILVEY